MRWTAPPRLALVLALAAGCSSSPDEAVAPAPTSTVPASSTTAAPTSSTLPPTTVGGPERCHSAQLQAALLPREGAAGTSFLPVRLRNTSSTACTLEGYMGLVLQDRGGHPVVADPQHDPDLPPAATGGQVLVGAGKTAQFVLAFSNIEPPDGGACPVVSKMEIVPPGETEPLGLGVSELLTPCGNERIGPVTPPLPS